MSTPKRYYWMKLKDSFMTSDTIDYFMSQPDGANYVVLYQMLCLKTINTAGRLSRQIGEIIIPYDVEKIRRDMKWFSADTIRVALKLYQAVGLVYEDVDGSLVLTDHQNLVGSESDAAARMRNSRANRRNALPGATQEKETKSVTDGAQRANIVTPDIDIRDRDRDKEKEIDININSTPIQDSTPTQEDILPGAVSAPDPRAAEPAVISLTLNDKTEYPITQIDVDEWQELYQAVDVMAELRKMRGWLNANPAKRKTKAGIRRFVNAWLAREQDKPHPTTQAAPQTARQNENVFLDMLNERRGGSDI